jgi:hypothetical protein
MTRAFVAMALAFVVPGAGHFFLGRRGRAMAFFAIVVCMFLIGISIEGGLYLLSETRGQALPQLASVASMGSGALYWLGNTIGPRGNILVATYEYGRTFTLTAGLMNLLLVLDCFDIARGRKP